MSNQEVNRVIKLLRINLDMMLKDQQVATEYGMIDLEVCQEQASIYQAEAWLRRDQVVGYIVMLLTENR